PTVFRNLRKRPPCLPFDALASVMLEFDPGRQHRAGTRPNSYHHHDEEEAMKHVMWVVASAVLVLAFGASAVEAQDAQRDRREIRRDTRDIRQDRRDIRRDQRDLAQDRRELRQDVKSRNIEAAKAERA